jgi:hypothetical protein
MQGAISVALRERSGKLMILPACRLSACFRIIPPPPGKF